MKSLKIATVLVLLSAALFSFCNRSRQLPVAETYLNLNDTVKYIGMETCRSCHTAIYDSYVKTGMGQSFHFASKSKSAADFTHKALYDSLLDFYYQPLWKNDSLFIKEYRLTGKDTIHSRIEKVSYIIGSGQHTNSHICNFNGYLFQAPVTFYTQQHRWDLAPGFEDGFNSRFSRVIGLECMTCHNSFPEFEKKSINKYNTVALGIDCERCHGPGEMHVNLKLTGEQIDTSKYIDYSIVNPKKLPRHLQMSLCQRCHLQGLAVLRNGKNFDDFKPGLNLSDVWDVFLPETNDSRSQFIMASHPERLRLSRCYRLSELSCITCHNPHVSVKETSVQFFNDKCKSCHLSKPCTEEIQIRMMKADNCSGCHMPKSGSIDIPHVSITDHYIRKDFEEVPDVNELNKVKSYLQLKCFTRDSVPASTMAEAYLSFYEKFSRREYLLDSAAAYLSLDKLHDMPEEVIHYYFLKGDYARLTSFANNLHADSILNPWTFYRVGEAHYSLGNYLPAYQYFQKACEAQPLNFDFQNKLGAVLTQLGKWEQAEEVFKKILREHSKFEPAWSNLGYLLMRKGDLKRAEEYFDRAIALNPDYENALLNKAMLCVNTQRVEQAKALALRITEINPKNEQAKILLQQ